MLSQVINTNKSLAQVIVSDSLSQQNSGHCGACGLFITNKINKSFILMVDNNINAQNGDLVDISPKPGTIINAIVFLFFIPTIFILIFSFLTTDIVWMQQHFFVSILIFILVMISYYFSIYLLFKNKVCFEIIQIHTKED